MIKQFRQALLTECRTQTKDRFLLAISGGMDSMCLLHLFQAAGFYFEIAHYNYQLRGADSDADEELVRQWAAAKKVPFHLQKAKKALGEKSGESLQMEARKLRYDWMENLRTSQQLNWIATAHHQQDQVETILFKLSKGTGLAGLRGMKSKQGKIIRPLLEISKEAIQTYIKDNAISFREDVSNVSTKYDRNFIRHEIIPLFKQLNPKVTEAISNSAKIIDEAESLNNWANEKWANRLLKYNKGAYSISLKALKGSPALRSILFSICRKLNCSVNISQEVHKLLNSESGKFIESDKMRIYKDRNHLYFYPKQQSDQVYTIFKKEITKIKTPFFEFHCKPHINIGVKELLQQATRCNISLIKIEFPLILRKWETGDYFYPSGLYKKSGKAGKQKISKYLKDHKFSAIDKDQCFVLTDKDNRIIWLVGHRTDERFKWKKGEAEALCFSIKKKIK